MFPAALLGEIHRRTQRKPRLINAVCDNLLLTAFALESKVATFAMLDEVTEDMRLEWPGGKPGDPARRRPPKARTKSPPPLSVKKNAYAEAVLRAHYSEKILPVLDFSVKFLTLRLNFRR